MSIAVSALPWADLRSEVDEIGCAQTGPLLTGTECAELADLWDEGGLFRSTIDMARYRFGRGTYRYFGDPVPERISELRAAFYDALLPIARDWADRLGDPSPWPDDFADWLALCHDAGQPRPTPILLSYGPDDWNALHRDL